MTKPSPAKKLTKPAERTRPIGRAKFKLPSERSVREGNR